MITSIIIAALSCIFIILSVLFFPKLEIGRIKVDTYCAVAFAGALIMIISGQVDISKLVSELTSDSSVNPLKILVLFLSMTLLSVFLDEIGFFRFVAAKALSIADKSQMKLFAILYLTVSVLTVFTSNDIIVLTFTPFICYFAQNARISPIPYLVGEFIAANTMSMMLIIGNPTNIYIASAYSIGFVDYFLTMFLPTLASAFTAFMLLVIVFRKELKTAPTPSITEVKVENKTFLVIGLTILIVCTLILAVGPYFGIEMWAVSLTAVVVLFLSVGCICMIRKERADKLKNTLKRAPWQLVPFVLSMFIMILSLEQNGFTDMAASALGYDNSLLEYGIASFLSANIINNIPMSVLFCPIISHLKGEALTGAVYATIIGSNIGAYFTPIGALAGIMWMSMLKNQNVTFRYADFIKYGALLSVASLAVCLISLSIVI